MSTDVQREARVFLDELRGRARVNKMSVTSDSPREPEDIDVSLRQIENDRQAGLYDKGAATANCRLDLTYVESFYEECGSVQVHGEHDLVELLGQITPPRDSTVFELQDVLQHFGVSAHGGLGAASDIYFGRVKID